MDRPKSLPAPAQEGNGIGDRFLVSSERVKEVRRTMEGFVDPLGIVAPIAHAHVAWLMHPQELSELSMRFASDLAACRCTPLRKARRPRRADVVLPQPDDRASATRSGRTSPAGAC